MGIVLNYNGKEWKKLTQIPLNLNFWTVWGKSEKEVYMAGSTWSKDRNQRVEPYIGKWDGKKIMKDILFEKEMVTLQISHYLIIPMGCLLLPLAVLFGG